MNKGKIYAGINYLLWTILSIAYILQEDDVIAGEMGDTEWLNMANAVANILMDEEGDTSTEIPHFCDVCENFAAEIPAVLRENAQLTIPSDNLKMRDLIYYQYLKLIKFTISFYEETITDHLANSPYYNSYLSNQETLTKFSGLIEKEVNRLRAKFAQRQEDNLLDVVDNLLHKTRSKLVHEPGGYLTGE